EFGEQLHEDALIVEVVLEPQTDLVVVSELLGQLRDAAQLGVELGARDVPAHAQPRATTLEIVRLGQRQHWALADWIGPLEERARNAARAQTITDISAAANVNDRAHPGRDQPILAASTSNTLALA